MTAQWVVRLVFCDPQEPSFLMALEDELEAAGADASVTAQPNVDQWTVSIGTTGLTAPVAVESALRVVEKVYPGAHPLALEAISLDEFERRAAEPTLPVLVGASEVGELLGVTRQRVHQLRAHAAFPAPVVEVAMGPLWDERAVRKFAHDWERRPGRPAKTADGSDGSHPE